MKLASAWLLTAAGATELALAGPARNHVPSPQLQAEVMEAADAVPAPDPAPAFPPQSPVDQERYLRELVNELREENEQLRTLDDQVAALRQDLADREAERQYEVEVQAALEATLLQVVDMLRQDEERLAAGDTEGVDDDLAYAASALTGGAFYEVQAALESLRREDLYPARRHIAAAIALGSTAQ